MTSTEADRKKGTQQDVPKPDPRCNNVSRLCSIKSEPHTVHQLGTDDSRDSGAHATSHQVRAATTEGNSAEFERSKGQGHTQDKTYVFGSQYPEHFAPKLDLNSRYLDLENHRRQGNTIVTLENKEKYNTTDTSCQQQELLNTSIAQEKGTGEMRNSSQEKSLEKNQSTIQKGYQREGSTAPRDRQSRPESTLVSLVATVQIWAPETFPNVSKVLPHLPFSMILFAFPTFILVQALVSTGWVPLIAYGWFKWVERTGTVGAVGGMGFLSVVLSSVSLVVSK
jgi:hypothetical protein